MIKHTRGAAGIGLGTTIKYLRRTTSGAVGNGLGTLMKYLRQTTGGAAENGLGATIKFLRRPTRAGNGLKQRSYICDACCAADIGLSTTLQYLRCITNAAASIGLGTMASFQRRTTIGPVAQRAAPRDAD